MRQRICDQCMAVIPGITENLDGIHAIYDFRWDDEVVDFCSKTCRNGWARARLPAETPDTTDGQPDKGAF